MLFHNLRRTAVKEPAPSGSSRIGVFERYNITDRSDTQEAGRMAEEFLAGEHGGNLAQIT